MALGYRTARVVSLLLPYGGPLVCLVLWIVFGFNLLFLVFGFAWIAGFSVWVAIRYGVGDLRFASILQNDLMDDLTGARARGEGDVTDSEVRHHLSPVGDENDRLR